MMTFTRKVRHDIRTGLRAHRFCVNTVKGGRVGEILL